MSEIIKAYNDVPTIEIPSATGKVSGEAYLQGVAGLSVGAGSQVCQFDPYSGLWVGGRTFASAPFNVDLDGHVKMTDAEIVGYASSEDVEDLQDNALLKASTTQILSGVIKVGGNNIIIDGINRRIIINDGTYDRILIGYQQGGF